MKHVHVDDAQYLRDHRNDVDRADVALWTFKIQGRDVNVWGRYPEAVRTAEQYVQRHGLHTQSILLTGCSETLRRVS